MSAEPIPAGPIRVVTLDLARPHLDDVAPTAGLWVLGCRDGAPLALTEVDRSPAAPPLDAQLAALAAAHLDADLRWRDQPDHVLPTITVVVPSIVRRLDDLERCLATLDALDYPHYDVVVVDNRAEVPAEDPLAPMLAPRPRFRSVRAPQPGLGAARNVGIRAATGDVVAFTDDDVQVDAQWLRAFGARFAADPDLAVCTGLILPAELETPAQVYFERYYGGFAGERLFAPLTLRTGPGLLGRARLVARDEGGAVVRRSPLYGVGAYGAGANLAVRREAIAHLGGFDPALGAGTPAGGGEDLQILIDVLWNGGVVRYEPAAFVHHRHRRGYDELLRQLQASGTGLTATLTSAVRRDPTHLAGLALQVPRAVRNLGRQSLARLRGRRAGSTELEPAEGPLYPRELLRRELRGLPSGPLAYLRSRWMVRRWLSTHDEAAISSPVGPRGQQGGGLSILMNADVLAPLGGVELSSLQVAEALTARGHQIQLQYREGGSHAARWGSTTTGMRQVPSFRVRKGHPLTDLRAVVPSLRAARAVRPDVIYLNRPELLPWGVLASLVTGAPLVCHLRHYPDYPAIRQLSALTARFIAVSDFVRRTWVAAGVPAQKIQVVHNGVSPEAYPPAGLGERTAAREQLALPVDATVVLYYGRLSSEKGVHTLLQAWRSAEAHVPGGCLVLLGDYAEGASGQAYRDRLEGVGLHATRSYSSSDDVNLFLAAADLVVLPAEWDEPFGRVVIETMMTGRPIVATRSGGIPEILTGELAEFVVEPRDADALSAALVRWASWRSEDPALGSRLSAYASSRFTLEQTTDGIEQVLRDAARRRRPRGS